MRYLSSLAAAAVLAGLTPGDAAAAPCCREIPKWYGGISTSAVFLDDVELEKSIPAAATFIHAYDAGFGVSGAIGYRLSPYIRLELEAAYRRNDLDNVNGSPNAPGVGSNVTTAYMGNVYLDYDNATRLVPYIGAGAGMAYINPHTILTLDNGLTTETKHLKDWAPAFQFMGGITYDATQNPAIPMELYLGYRYFTTGDITIDYTIVPGYNRSLSNTSHNVELGARLYMF
jgi:opacity protein-like surface antigen